MLNRKNLTSLILCNLIWGFQPLYWGLIDNINSYTTLCCRIIMAAVSSIAILAFTHRLSEFKAIFRDKSIMKYLIPAVVFLLADWAVFIVAVNTGHVLDASLGYYINPLILFAFGVVIYKEKSTKIQLFALGVAAVGVIISTVAFGDFPFLSLVIAVNWSIYAAVKKNVKIDGVISIAAETLMLTPFAIAFLLIFKRGDFALMSSRDIIFLIGSGIATALPMYLYSDCVASFSLIIMCFAQYLGPTFNVICGFIRGERFSESQLISLAFFIIAIIIFTASEISQARKNKAEKL